MGKVVVLDRAEGPVLHKAGPAQAVRPLMPKGTLPSGAVLHLAKPNRHPLTVRAAHPKRRSCGHRPFLSPCVPTTRPEHDPCVYADLALMLLTVGALALVAYGCNLINSLSH